MIVVAYPIVTSTRCTRPSRRRGRNGRSRGSPSSRTRVTPELTPFRFSTLIWQTVAPSRTIAVLPREAHGSLTPDRLTKHEVHVHRRPRCKVQANLEGCARIQPGPDFARESHTLHRRRRSVTAVPAQKLRAIRRQSMKLLAGGDERDAVREVLVPGGSLSARPPWPDRASSGDRRSRRHRTARGSQGP